MLRLTLTLLLLAPSLTAADWTRYREAGCIGGDTCSNRRLRIALEDRPVVGIRFRAHDNIGARAGGELRVKIDGNTIRSNIDIPRAGETFSLDVEELTGRYLVFEPAADDEVEITDVAVLYGREESRTFRDRDRRGGEGRSGWRQYPNAAGCIGGDQCRKNGKRIMVPLDDAPVLGIRFFARDDIGTRADGKLAVRIDDTAIESYIDVQRAGKRHELEVDSISGSRLVIEATNDDEVDIREVEVLYGRGGRGGGRGGGGWQRGGQRELTHEGGCIGGSECGGKRARIRIPIDGRPVASIRFHARDDIGTRAGGELRIRVDDTILRDDLDIPREGRTFTIDGRGTEGDYLIIEPAEDDEVMVKDIRVTFGRRED